MTFMVYWKKMLNDKTDAPMMAFDTSIESRAYIKGFIDCLRVHDKKVDEFTLISEFEVRQITQRRNDETS
jgi:hypothetical protein